MLLMVILVLFGACVVSSNPVKISSGHSIEESKADVEWQDDVLIREERGRGKCKYDGKWYKKGATIVKPDYARCDRCKCIRGKFRRCTKIYVCEIDQLNCDKKDYEFPPGECCPVCKLKSCDENRNVTDKWQMIKKVESESPLSGVCSLCECRNDRKEYCEDHTFTCFKIPGCLEYEIKPDHCCPQCSLFLEPTTEPWFTIQLTTERPDPTFPFTFPFRDSNEDQPVKIKNGGLVTN